MILSRVWWAIFALIILLVELVHFSWIIIWFALGAVAASILSYFYPENILLQVELFLFVSIVSLALLRPLTVFVLKSATIRTNVGRIIGKEEVCVEKIDNARSTGAVKLF